MLIFEMYKFWLVEVFSAFRKKINVSFVIIFKFVIVHVRGCIIHASVLRVLSITY